jgi:LysR family transcriptional regulator, hydrogen peroxide-inducible genes activator
VPTLRQLGYLVAVADTLHFRRAAERSNTTQSTLSTQLQALEERLGACLVERTKTRVCLTSVGEDVVTIARRMLRDAEDIRSLAKCASGTLSGVLRVGIPPTIGPSLLPRIIPKICRAFPDLKLHVREDLPKALPVDLEAGHYDIIVLPMAAGTDGVNCAPLFEEQLFLVHHTGHPLNLKKDVSWDDLRGLDVLALEAGHQCHDLVQSLCEQSSARVLRDYESTSLDMLREMVATGLGCTFMPALYVEAKVRADENLAVRRVAGHRISRVVGMAWRNSEPRHRELKSLAGLIRSELSAINIAGVKCLSA